MSDAGSAAIPVKISILDKEYTVGSQPEARDALLAAAHALDTKMREIRGANRMAAMDRVMVLAALNFISEFQALQHSHSTRETELASMIGALSAKLDDLPLEPLL